MATGLSCHDWLGGRDDQSIAFLSAAVREKLYSGHAISTPSASAISARSRFAGSGMPASNTSWLKSGRSAMVVTRRLMPWGMSSAQVRSATMLREPFLRLPQIPRICMGVKFSGFVLILAAAGAGAQQLEPRLYSSAPVGMNFAIAGYTYSSGGLAMDPSLPVENAELELNAPILAYARSFGVRGQSAKLDAVLAGGCLAGSAE